jgi:hypothetical protein
LNHNDKVTELLKNYKSYKYAVRNGIAPHDDSIDLGIRSGGFGSRSPILSGRGSWDASINDYNQYSRAVNMIEGAVREVLDDNERKVIELKYLERNTITLVQIAYRIGYSETQVKRFHKSALKQLSQALIMVDVPEIINLDLLAIV